MTHRPLMMLIVGLILGITGAAVDPIKSTIAMAVAALAWLAAGIGLWKAWRYNAWVFFCAFVALGFALTCMKQETVKSPLILLAGQRVQVTGQVIDRPDVRFDGVFYKVEVSRVNDHVSTRNMDGVLRVKVRGQGKVYKYGDILVLTGLLSIPEAPGNPGAFDYRAWLTRQGIAATLAVKDSGDVKMRGRGGNPVVITAFKVRDALEHIFDQNMSKTRAAVLKGILFGTRGEIPREVNMAFSETGLVHILSVSGFHVGLVAGMIFFLLRLCRLPHRFFAPVAISLLFFYAVMTGLGPAVTRSTFMAILLLLARHFGRQQDWPTTLTVAAGIILILNPLTLFDIGFQLSFLATWGLLYLTPKLLPMVPNLPRPLSLLIMVPLAAQLATLPLVVLYFNLVSPVSILANLLTTYLITLIMLFGGISLLLGVIYLPLAGLALTGTGLLTDLFLWLVTLCSSIPGASFYIPAPPLWGIVLYYVFLVAGTELLNRPQWQAKVKDVFLNGRMKQVHIRILLGTALLLLMVFIWLVWPDHNKLEIHFVDVGQGDSTLIITPNQRTILVDAGGWKDELLTGRGAGDQVVVPYLHRLGINRLDVLVISHPHGDHAGGVRAVTGSMEVGMVMVSPYGLGKEDKTDNGYDVLLKKIKAQGIKVHQAKAGDLLKIDPEISIKVVSPAEKLIGTRSDANNNSLVLLISYLQRTVLLTGDIEVEAEEQLIDKNEFLATEIVKVPHHGSGYFHPDFFSKINPQASIISVGANNTFGHPAEATLEELQELHCKVYRTDQQGAIILTTDGVKWQVRTGKVR